MAKNIDVEILRQRLREAGPDPASLHRVLNEMGISLDNPEAVQFLSEVGLDLSGLKDKNELTSLIDRMVAGLDQETRQQVAGFLERLAGEKGGSLPPDLAQFLAKWQQGR